MCTMVVLVVFDLQGWVIVVLFGSAILLISVICICRLSMVSGRDDRTVRAEGCRPPCRRCGCTPVSRRRRSCSDRTRRGNAEDATSDGNGLLRHGGGASRKPDDISGVGVEHGSDDVAFMWKEYYGALGDEELHNLSCYSGN